MIYRISMQKCVQDLFGINFSSFICSMIRYLPMILPLSSLSSLIDVTYQLFSMHVVHDTFRKKKCSYDTLIVSSLKRFPWKV
jgi:hypothetical protein